MSTATQQMIDSNRLANIQRLYKDGLYLQAYQLAVESKPLSEWTASAEERSLAGRIAHQVGAPRLARWHRLRAWREFPDDLEVRYYFAWSVWETRGPYTAWEFLQKRGDAGEASADQQSSWYALHASLLGQLRDFDQAEKWIAKAEEASPDDPWIQVSRASMLEMEDRYDESLAAAKRALQLQPWFRPAVQSTAHVLKLLGRDDEALDLLGNASERIESGLVVVDLAALQFELQRFTDVGASLDRYEQLSPLIEKKIRKWIASRRSRVAYHLGNVREAIRLAKESEEPYYEQIAKRLENAPPDAGKPELLQVGFVRQHHVTCVPATCRH